MKFDIKLKLDLDFLGDGWKDCYLSFSPITVRDAKELRNLNIDDTANIEKGIQLVKEKFIEGKALAKGELIDVKAEDLDDFPITIITKIIELMVGSMSGNEKKTPS